LPVSPRRAGKFWAAGGANLTGRPIGALLAICRDAGAADSSAFTDPAVAPCPSCAGGGVVPLCRVLLSGQNQNQRQLSVTAPNSASLFRLQTFAFQ